MDTATLTLADFLLARIADDEEAAADPYWGTTDGLIGSDRMLAECEAKRRIVGLADWTGEKDSIRDRVFGPSADFAFQAGIRAAMQILAAVYADHPDYREEWKP